MGDEMYLRRAIALAVAAARTDGGPFGAIVVRDGAVLGEGTNAVVGAFDPTAHAEVQAIRAACRASADHRLAGAVLYSSTEPCPMCLGAAWWARVDRVVFAADRHRAAAAGFDDSDLYTEVAVPLPERRLPVVQALPDEGDAPFDAWFANPGRIHY